MANQSLLFVINPDGSVSVNSANQRNPAAAFERRSSNARRSFARSVHSFESIASTISAAPVTLDSGINRVMRFSGSPGLLLAALNAARQRNDSASSDRVPGANGGGIGAVAFNAVGLSFSAGFGGSGSLTLSRAARIADGQ